MVFELPRKFNMVKLVEQKWTKIKTMNSENRISANTVYLLLNYTEVSKKIYFLTHMSHGQNFNTVTQRHMEYFFNKLYQQCYTVLHHKVTGD